MSEKTRKKPVYSSEFKAKAVAKCLDIGVSATSKELGVSYVSLSNWVQRSGGQPSSPVAKPSYEDLEREVQSSHSFLSSIKNPKAWNVKKRIKFDYF